MSNWHDNEGNEQQDAGDEQGGHSFPAATLEGSAAGPFTAGPRPAPMWRPDLSSWLPVELGPQHTLKASTDCGCGGVVRWAGAAESVCPACGRRWRLQLQRRG